MIVRHGALYCLVRCSTWFTRRGYDWSDRYPAIAVTATLLRARSFTLDGEAVVCGSDGVAIFDAFHRRGTVSEAMLYAFDLLELDGDDPYRSGPSRDWIKVKNPNSPAMIRAREAEW
jgi:ATP-dependent DNA ligase